MNFLELFLIAVGLSMDAFAVSVCSGLTMQKVTVKKAAVTGLYFGVFQAGMPVIGYLAATLFAEYIIAYDHWVAFGLLCFLGGRMIYGALHKEDIPAARGDTGPVEDGEAAEIEEAAEDGEIVKHAETKKISRTAEASLKPAAMLPLAVATSIDALAVGVSFAFLRVNIIPAVTLIGITTLVLSVIGVKIGNMFGLKYKSKAELTGGAILILLGINILLEHMGI